MKFNTESVNDSVSKFQDIAKNTAALAAIFFSTIAFSAAASAQEASQFERDYYTIGRRTVREVADSGFSPYTVLPGGGVGSDGSWIGDVNEASLILDQVINMGKKIWAIIEANKPVVNLQIDTANALPRGLQDWTNLEGWSAPSYRTYHVTYENLYGVTVVDFTYRVLYTYGGSANGKGAYLANLTVVPAELTVLWGYKFTVNVTVPSVTNAGTHDNPVAAAQLQVTWKVDTVIKHNEITDGYYIRGDGAFSTLN